MTTWEIVDDADGIDVQISAEGRAQYEAEQRANRRSAEIRVGTIAAALLCIAVLVIKQILGS